MSENIWFSDVFRGYRNETLDWNGLNKVHQTKREKRTTLLLCTSDKEIEGSVSRIGNAFPINKNNICHPQMFCKYFSGERWVIFSSLWIHSGKDVLNPSRPSPWRREKTNLNFCFHTLLWCLKRFYRLRKTFWGHHKRMWKLKFKLIFSLI